MVGTVMTTFSSSLPLSPPVNNPSAHLLVDNSRRRGAFSLPSSLIMPLSRGLNSGQQSSMRQNDVGSAPFLFGPLANEVTALIPT